MKKDINLQLLNIPTKTLRSLAINVTYDCKLRCIYCPTISDSWNRTDATPKFLQELTEYAIENQVSEVHFGLWGDTLSNKDWVNYAKQLQKNGIRLSIHSAFNRLLSKEELEVLSSFSTVTMSIDTPDIVLQKKIRKGLDIRTLIHNLHEIRATAILQKRRPPLFIWMAVLTNQVLDTLPDYVSYALSNHVDEISFADYNELQHNLKSVF